jgi:hypothetical protein
MPELFSEEYERAKEKWENVRDNYVEAVNLYEAIYKLLLSQHKELEIAAREFAIEQAKVIKNIRTNLKVVKKGS